MARQGPYVQLRPLGGGREWDADPAHVRLLTPAELLSARVADVNTRSREGLVGVREDHTMRLHASHGGEQ
nr:hypothetical protein [Streptomyces camponoticapitis]